MTAAERARLAALAEAATPGPWQVHRESDGSRVTYYGMTMAWCGTSLAMSREGRWEISREQAHANADLFAAVPALLLALADAERRAEAAELGCEIAYRREPTQAEGDAHAYRAHKGDVIEEAHVPMGNHHGHRCRCRLWVWGGPTVCVTCVAADAVACVQAQRDIILDASAEGSWMARALDAEAERDRLRARAERAEARLVAQNRFDGFGHDEDHEAAFKARWAFRASKGGE